MLWTHAKIFDDGLLSCYESQTRLAVNGTLNVQNSLDPELDGSQY